MSKRKHAYLFVTISLVLLFSLSLMWLGGCPFFGQKYTLTTTVSPAGGGFVSPSGGDYDSGVMVTLTATPASGYTFDYWSGSVAGTNSTVILTMDADKSVIAYFEAAPEEYTLTTSVSPSGAGSVSPSGGQYDDGTVVTLTATPASGYAFDYWGGSASGSNPTTSITMNSDESVTAYFVSSITVLFSDDFSWDTGLWDVYSDANGEVFFQNGQLHLLNYTTAPGNTYSYAYQWFDDFVLSVETELVSGTDDNWHIVDVRDQINSWYSFQISADGYYQIAKMVSGTYTSLTSGTSSYINQGWNVTNLITIECIGNYLSLWVNGYLLDDVIDNSLSSGDISLGVSSLAGSYSEITFDNIVVIAP